MTATNYAYTCGDCQRDIMQGETHICPAKNLHNKTVSYKWPNTYEVSPDYQSLLTPVIAIDGETKRLLERIATALEKLAGTGL